MATTTATPTVRYIGVTDECIECQKCGKADLRSTVVLALLDADGNDEEVTYYGSTCAARALATRGVTVKGGGRAILQSAQLATRRAKTNAADAREFFARYGIPEQGDLTPREWRPIRWEFVTNNTRNQPEIPYGHPDFKGADWWQATLLKIVEIKRGWLRDAALLGL